MAKIEASLSGANLTGLRLIISYIPTATEAQDFAESIAEFLINRLRIHCEWPTAINSNAGSQPQARVNGTVFIVATSASDTARTFADAFASTSPEIERSGENPAWQFQTSLFQIRIIVGHKR